MKRILIAGIDSYIGNSIKKWLNDCDDNYIIDEIDMRNDEWEKKDFFEFDVILYIAGIVHIKEKKELWPLYHNVNTLLPYKVALKAKYCGVPHFVFFSTKGVYKPNTKHINFDTQPAPTKMYGKSKLEGEKLLLPLNNVDFHVSILRPAVVYGEGCKGNFPRLVILSEKMHVFPQCTSRRSMIYIWNLCEYVRRVIEQPLKKTILFPQDRKPVSTTNIMKELWRARGERYYVSKFGGLCVKYLIKMPGLNTLKTMFMETIYDETISNDFNYEYCVYTFEQAIQKVALTK